MHHRLAGAQLRQVADKRVGVNGAAALLTAARHALAQQIAFADKRPVAQGVDKPALRRADAQITAAVGGIFETQQALRCDFNARQQFRERLAAALTFYRENYRPGERFKKTAQAVERRFLLGLNGDIRQRLIAEIGIRGFIGERFGFQLYARPGFQLRMKFISAQPEFFRWQQRTHRVNAAVLITRDGVGPEAVSARLKIACAHYQRVFREIAEQRRQRLAEEQRLPVFDPGGQGAFAHLLIDMLRVTLDLETVAPLAAEQFNGRFVGRKFVRRQQIYRLDLFQRALGVDVKQPQAVDFVIEKVDAVGLFAAHRVEIEQRAAGGVFAMRHHLIHMTIARLVELAAQGVARQLLAFLHHQRVAVQEAVRADALHQRVHRQDQHAALHGGQLIERREARGDNLLMRRETVVRQRLPVGEVHDQAFGKLLNFIMQAQGVLHIRRDKHQRAGVAFRHFRHLDGAGRAGQFTQLTLIARFDGQSVTILFRHRRRSVLRLCRLSGIKTRRQSGLVVP
ncbi:2C-methyl-D-erythritol 2,4-cyclodiphosphate synthase(EC:4.6.1.12) [Cronobacter muytjensii 530]